MALTNYLTLTRQFLNDPSSQRYTDANLTTFINIGRSQLALRGQCVRFNFGLDGILFTGTFTASSTSVTGVTPTAANTLDTVTGWVMAGVHNAMATGTTVSSYTGTTMVLSAAATASGTYQFMMSPPNVTVANQEMYQSPATSTLCLTNGISNVVGVQNVAVNWGSYGSNLYTAIFQDWPVFQAFQRQYPYVSGNPWYWSRYQNIYNGIFLRPIPSQAYPMQWDCLCNVVNLATDSTPEAIPYAYTDAVPYFAAYIALMTSQRKEDAGTLKTLYEEFCAAGRKYFLPQLSPNIYETI